MRSFFRLSPFSFYLSPVYAKQLMDVVETDEESATDSLNRIAGEIDLGFSKSDSKHVTAPNYYQPSSFSRKEQDN